MCSKLCNGSSLKHCVVDISQHLKASVLTLRIICSHIGPLVSASLESTQDTVRQNTRLRSLLSEEGDDSSQLELSEASEDDGDLGDAKFAKPAYKRGRKVSNLIPCIFFTLFAFS